MCYLFHTRTTPHFASLFITLINSSGVTALVFVKEREKEFPLLVCNTKQWSFQAAPLKVNVWFAHSARIFIQGALFRGSDIIIKCVKAMKYCKFIFWKSKAFLEIVKSKLFQAVSLCVFVCFRGACVRQHQALRATLSLLRSSGSALTDVRGFLSQLTRAWQAFRSQIMQHNTQVYSGNTDCACTHTAHTH